MPILYRDRASARSFFVVKFYYQRQGGRNYDYSIPYALSFCRLRGDCMYIYYNPNPQNNLVGDCVIRAIAKVTGQSWEQTYIKVALQGLLMHDMPSSNSVWGAYLAGQGFKRHVIPNTCPDCYTVKDFCADYPQGAYILATGTHVIAVVDGDYYDTWNSGDEVPIYFFKEG